MNSGSFKETEKTEVGLIKESCLKEINMVSGFDGGSQIIDSMGQKGAL